MTLLNYISDDTTSDGGVPKLTQSSFTTDMKVDNSTDSNPIAAAAAAAPNVTSTPVTSTPGVTSKKIRLASTILPCEDDQTAKYKRVHDIWFV